MTALARDGSAFWVGGERLIAVDAATGEQLPGGKDGPVHDLAVAAERLIVAGPSGVAALAATGAVWEVAGEVVDLDVRDGIVYAAGPAGAVARRASDGDELVRFAAEEPRAIAAGDGVVVVPRAQAQRVRRDDGSRSRVVRRRRRERCGGRRRPGRGRRRRRAPGRRPRCAQGKRRDVCFSSVLSGSRSNTRTARRRHRRRARDRGHAALCGR